MDGEIVLPTLTNDENKDPTFLGLRHHRPSFRRGLEMEWGRVDDVRGAGWW